MAKFWKLLENLNACARERESEREREPERPKRARARITSQPSEKETTRETKKERRQGDDRLTAPLALPRRSNARGGLESGGTTRH